MSQSPKSYRETILENATRALISPGGFRAWPNGSRFTPTPSCTMTHLPSMPLDALRSTLEYISPGFPAFPISIYALRVSTQTRRREPSMEATLSIGRASIAMATPTRGNLLGSWIGREGKGGQAWLTYWLSPRESIELGYRNAKVAAGFIPGGTTQNDFSIARRRPA